MKVLRTPDSRFANLADYPFAPHYTTITTADGSKLRIHHIDEGPAEGPVALCMHGQPVWSYLYRKVVPYLTSAGLRVIAPDLVGYGKSDKPAEREDYSYERQVEWMGAWLEANDFRGITFFGQDWGGLIGLRMIAADPDRFAGSNLQYWITLQSRCPGLSSRRNRKLSYARANSFNDRNAKQHSNHGQQSALCEKICLLAEVVLGNRGSPYRIHDVYDVGSSIKTPTTSQVFALQPGNRFTSAQRFSDSLRCALSRCQLQNGASRHAQPSAYATHISVTGSAARSLGIF